jgi:hypothetical protein
MKRLAGGVAMFVYAIQPIDFWNGWQNPSDLFRVSTHEYSTDYHNPAEWGPAWTKAKELARQVGWEGDIREGPYVTVLPHSDGGFPPFVIGWKQENNGDTFIAAPFELPWLAQEYGSKIEG